MTNKDDEPIQKGYDFTPSKFIEPMMKKDYIAVAEEIRIFIDHFNLCNVIGFGEADTQVMHDAARLIFAIIAEPDFVIPEPYLVKFATAAVLFANLAKITNIGTTDEYLNAIAHQPQNVFKLLTLYTPDNVLDIQIEEIFKANPQVASAWYAMLSNQYRGVKKEHFKKYRKWMLNEKVWDYFTISNNNFRMFDWLTHPGFDISYLSPQHERKVREAIVRDIVKIKSHRTKPLSTNFKNVLVISTTFLKGKAVFKPIANFLKELKKGGYSLTYLHCAHDGNVDRVDCNIFDKAIVGLTQEKGVLPEMFKELQEGDYGIIIYPDTWLNFNNVILGCSRFAPIQISTYGHPASTQCPEIDYFIGGQDTEAPQNYSNYSERLILLPGNGNCPLPVEFKEEVPEAEDYQICCSWGHLKMNWESMNLLLKLKERAENAGKEVKFYFSDVISQRLTYLAVKKDMEEIFGKSVIIMPSLKYDAYMRGIGGCKFAIDSFPFGGYNRILDLLSLGRPVIIREGDKAYNRMNAAILKRMGLSELVVQKPEQVLRKAMEIIENEDYRLGLIDKIRKADLYHPEDAKYFRKAIDLITSNHRAFMTFKTKNPIVVKADDL